MTARQRLAQIAFDRGGLLVLATLVVYIWIVPVQVVDGEGAHFALLGAFGGAAHPSGYPSYVLWLRALSWLPGSTPAQIAGIATAILGAAQMGVLHAACRAWGARPAAASVAVAIFAGAPIVLGLYTEPEVFALNGLVVALVLWLSASAGPVRGAWRAVLLGLVAGLGLANHLTCVLVAPVGLLGLVRGARETTAAKAIGLALVGLALGLAPYLYLVVAPVHDGTWGQIDGVATIANMILRHDYGGPSAFAGAGSALPILDNEGALAATLGRTWLWAPGIVGLATLGWRALRRAGERWSWVMLLVCFVLAGPLLASRFNVPLDVLGRYVVARFHVLPALLLAIPVAVGLDRIAVNVAAWLPSSLARSRSVAGLIATLGFAAAVGTALPHVLRAHAPAVEQEAHNTLRSLPPNAVVIGEHDDLFGAITYVQVAFGERTDVAYVHWPMVPLPWYRQRLVQHGISIDASDGHVSSVPLVVDLLGHDRPVFVEPSKRILLESFAHYPFGILSRLVPGSKIPSVKEIFALDQAIYATFTFDYERPGDDDAWPTAVHQKYAWTWQLLSRMLAAEGDRDDAAWALAAAREIGPR